MKRFAIKTGTGLYIGCLQKDINAPTVVLRRSKAIRFKTEEDAQAYIKTLVERGMAASHAPFKVFPFTPTAAELLGFAFDFVLPAILRKR